MRRKYLVLLLVLLVPLVIGLTGCGKKRRYLAPPPEPGVPTNLVATAVSSTQIDLVWMDNSTDEKGFYVYRRNGGSYRRIAALDPNTTSYNNTGLSPGTIYWYKITAYGDAGESGSSNEASAKTMADIEILDHRIERKYFEDSQNWETRIIGHVKNNTDQILTIKVAGSFYSYTDKWIAEESCHLWDVNSGRTVEFKIYHWGKTKIKYVKVWIAEYY